MSLISGPVRETAASARLVAANANLRRINLALAGSMIGDWAYNTAIAVWLYQQGGAAYVGGYAVARLLLMALGLPFLTTLVDRWPKKAFLITTDLLRAGLVLIAAVLIWLDGPPLVVVTLAVIVGFIGGPFRPAEAALLPRLAHSPQELTAANAMSSTLESLAFFIGPAIAGLLLVVTGVPVLFVINAASFVWSALMIARLTIPPQESESPDSEANEPPTRFLAEAMAGFRVIGADRSLLLLSALACGQTLIAGAAVVFTVTIALEVVLLGDPGVGYLNAVMGVGAICGGLVALGPGGAWVGCPGLRRRRARLGGATGADRDLALAGVGVPGVHADRLRQPTGRRQLRDFGAAGRPERGAGPGLRGAGERVDRGHGARRAAVSGAAGPGRAALGPGDHRRAGGVGRCGDAAPSAPIGPDRCRRRRIWTWSRRWRCSSRCSRRCRRTWPAS